MPAFIHRRGLTTTSNILKTLYEDLTGNGFDNISIWIYASIGRTSLKPAIYAFSTSMTIFASLVIVGIMIFKNIKNRKEQKNESK
ncbi:MAG: hypothetical protein EOM74_02860 [Methanomicrobia archaeon]|nr:hypothetical protein [Methanomicrobia archaeon]